MAKKQPVEPLEASLFESPAAPQPSAPAPVATKPVTTKPITTKPIEIKPVVVTPAITPAQPAAKSRALPPLASQPEAARETPPSPPISPLIASQLSDVQQAAVTHDAGPLVVLAGPGTGKTRVIIHRVAHAVTQRGVQPEHVLACTFTVAAARELRERLSAVVGEALASRVRAMTLHGFGTRIISRFRGLLGLPSRTTLLDRVGQRRLLKEVALREAIFADALALGLKHMPSNQLALPLAQSLSQSPQGDEEADEEPPPRNEGVQSLDTMLESAEHALEAIANAGLLHSEALEQAQQAVEREEAAPRTANFEAALLKAQHTLMLARLNDVYCRERWSRGLFIFADLQLLPLLGLTSIPTIASLVRADLKCIVVDEFQDCNPAQVRLLSLLAGPASKKPDLCVVGDDDQGIYAFRGASDRAFDLFESLYPAPRVLKLEENHRSTDAIVSVAHATISRATHRYRPDKRVRSARSSSGSRVELTTYEGAAGYINAVVAETLRVRDAARQSGKPLLNELAIIVRGNKDAGEIASLLRASGVACKEANKESPFEHSAVRATLAWARWLVSDAQGQHVLDVLRSPPWSITPQTAAALYNQHRALQAQLRHARIASAIEAGSVTAGARGPNLRWNAYLSSLCATPTSDASASIALPHDIGGGASLLATIASVLAMHAQLRESALALPASQAIEAIVQATDPIGAGLPDASEQVSRVRAVLALLGVARAKQALLPAPGTLPALLDYLDELIALDPEMRDLRSGTIDDDAGEEWRTHEVESTIADIDEPDSQQAEEGVVQVLTAHGSKGLEFGTVLVPRVSSDGYCKSSKEHKAALPEGLLAFGEIAPLTAEELSQRAADENRRIFYVACTRAKDRLVLYSRKTKRKSTAAIQYFQELADASASLPVLISAAPVGLHSSDGDAPSKAGSASLAAAGLLPRTLSQRKQAMMQQLRAQLARALDWLASGSSSGDAAASDGSPELLIARARALASADPLAAARELGPQHAGFVRALEAALSTRAQPKASSLPLPRAPLQLSYTSIDLFQCCPRCWYVRQVLCLPDSDSKRRLVGTVTHGALEQFCREWTACDSEGAPLPGLPRLHAIATQRWRADAPQLGGADEADVEADLSHIRALLSNCWQKLHKPTDHVLEVEFSTTLQLAIDGATHTLHAKIDRIDQLPSGGVRVIDYKTGFPSKARVEPSKTDLQLGIYAMALQQAFPDVDLATSFGEYWLLQSGQRGVLAFSDLNIAGVRADIAKAVRSMLSSSFPRLRSNCRGHCVVLPESIAVG